MRVLRVAVVVLLAVGSACAPRVRVPATPSPPAVVPRPAPPAHTLDEMAFVATAYCLDGRTASGVRTSHGVVAADPGVLPMGTRIRVTGLKYSHDGVYRVMDTGQHVRGRRIDVFLTSCAEAKRFGRQPVHVAVLK